MTSFLDFLLSVPAVIWSAVIASCITLGGVFLSNKSNNYRLRLQLEHDSKEKAKEHISILRRDIYLRTIEELQKANSHLSSLPNLDLTKSNLDDGLKGFMSTAAKLQLIAEPKTALLVNQLITEYGVIALDLFGHLAPIYESKNDIKISDEFYNKSQVEISRLIEEMRRINESGKTDQIVMDALQQSFDFQMALSKRYADERATGWSNFNHYNIAFQKRFLVFIKQVSRKSIPMIIEIRRDLGLSGELVDLEAQMKVQEIRLEASLNKLIQNLGKPLAEDKAE